MDIHHLPVYNTQRTELLFPVEIFWKEIMRKRQEDEQYANDFKMKFHVMLSKEFFMGYN